MEAATVKACSCHSDLAGSLADRSQGGAVVSGPVEPNKAAGAVWGQ